MRVLLKRAVKGLGEAGEVKKVADGYGANYLIPRGLAVAATPGVIKAQEEKAESEARKHAQEMQSAQVFANRLQSIVLTFTARAGENGKLYGSITNSDIASGLEMETGRAFDKRKIALQHPIRELGKYQVPIKLMPEITPEITVVVEAESE